MREQKIQMKLLELSKRASAIRADPNLRHAPSNHDIAVASENTKLMRAYQYQTIKAEGEES
ncbi:MAG: hypothetical protein FWC66_06890 [Oscillospiraceae bacterium]|nr:hypothetical protein [Oscillospiraceae bacterium]